MLETVIPEQKNLGESANQLGIIKTNGNSDANLLCKTPSQTTVSQISIVNQF